MSMNVKPVGMAPTGVYTAFMHTNDRGRSRVENMANNAINGLDALIGELEREIQFLEHSGDSERLGQVKETLTLVKERRAKVVGQRDQMLDHMDRSFNKASQSVSERSLKALKKKHQKDFVELRKEIVTEYKKVNKAVGPTFAVLSEKYDTDHLRAGAMFQELAHRKDIEDTLGARGKLFRTVSKTVHFKSERGGVAKSTITPANELEGQLVPDIAKTPMLDSSQRASSDQVVNFHVSSYKKGQRPLVGDLNRTAVLSVDKKYFPDNAHEVNRRKVNKLFQHELSQQLLTPERTDELEAIRQQIKDKDFIQSEDGIPYLNIEPIEVEHFTLSLLTMADKEREMFEGEYEAMHSLSGQTIYHVLEIDGQKVRVPAKFNVHVMNTGVAEISTTRLARDGFSLKALAGTLLDTITGMSKRQKKVNQQAWEGIKQNYATYESNIDSKIQKLEARAVAAEAAGDKKQVDHLNKSILRMRINRDKARVLFNQLQETNGPEGYADITGNPYAVGARLILLSRLMGMSVHFHCKSGKDRTGMMDIEVKYLAETLDRNRTADPGNFKAPPLRLEEETSEQREIRNKIALRGGNTEIALHNTGEIGLKTIRRKENVMRYGAETAEVLAGESDLSTS